MSGEREEKIPQTFWEYLKAWGPGIAAVLTWAGAGDLVDCAAAGASYGYALMWALTIALLLRGVIVSIMAKYELCNPHRETLIAAYKRLGTWVAWILIVAFFFYAHIYGAFLLKGSGVGLWLLSGKAGGEWGLFAWCVVLMIVAVLIWGQWGQGKYKYIEYLFKVTLALMTITFLGTAAIAIARNPAALGKMILGAIAVGWIPPGVGPWEASFMAVATIGAIGGSIANFLYPYFIKGKGWTDERYIKVQRFDLWLAIIVVIILDAAIWTVGAEILHPQGIHVTSVEDIAYALVHIVGTAGAVLVYAGLFVTAYDTYIGLACGLCMGGIDSIHQVMPERKEKYKSYENDPWYRYAIYYALITPIIWALPGMPGFIFMVLFMNALSVVIIPIIAIGLLIIANKAEFIGEKYKNKWWENLLLIVIVAIALWSTYHLIMSFIK
jgi:Mn2+/Fe2+ NRAMP family transporter